MPTHCSFSYLLLEEQILECLGCMQKARELHPDVKGQVHDAAFVSLLQAYEVGL